MAIRRPPLPADSFTIIPNAWMRDPKLSYRAKGLLAYIAGHAPGHELTVEQIIGEGAEGREAVRAAIRDLEVAGYLVRFPRRVDNRVAGTDFELRDPTAQKPVVSSELHKCSNCAGQATAQEPVVRKSPPKKTNTSEDQEEKTKGSVEPDGTTRLDSTDPRPEFVRDDVEQLCSYLANRIEENGSKRPAVTNRWREACRLLIDKDGRTAEQVQAAINWSQDHEFWRSNILSMNKLREKYDQLRLQAVRERARPTSGAPSGAQFKNSEEQTIERRKVRQARAKVLDALMEQGLTFDEAKERVAGLADHEFLKLLAPSSATGYIDGDVIDSTQRPEVES